MGTQGYRSYDSELGLSPMNDWMRAIRTPTSYRVGTSAIRLNTMLLAKIAIGGIVILTCLVFLIPGSSDFEPKSTTWHFAQTAYNQTYPLSEPIKTSDGLKYKIAAIADPDTASKSTTEKYTWYSYMKTGTLTISNDHKKVDLKWNDDVVTLKSQVSAKDRGMELSELIIFNGKLYSPDDRTGIIYEITSGHKMLPWVILNDGNGHVSKGFKAEWMTVKNERLLVGGLGKEWTSTKGVVENLNPQWIKSIGPDGDVKHIDWHVNYDLLREKTKTSAPGYMIHEAVVWSNVHNKFVFLPRRVSTETYDETKDERRASNTRIMADESFKQIEVDHVGPLSNTRGFSSFKFIPNTSDNIVLALKSEEDAGKISSYVTVFTMSGDIIVPETLIGDIKYEGIEFV